jgi:hypothetical protein
MISRAPSRRRAIGLSRRVKEVRLIGDAVIAAFFAADKPKAREKKRAEVESWLGASPVKWEPLSALALTLKQGAHPLTPFHWEVEFPEVFARKSPGFDSILGNPPFMWGNRISTVYGEAYRDWLLVIHPGSHGNSDLVAHFFRSAVTLLQSAGTFGLLATNSISEADTRQTGLDWLLNHGASIYYAVRNFRWTGSANVRIALVCGSKQRLRGIAKLDGQAVASIGSDLRSGTLSRRAEPLVANARRCFKGVDFGGVGFLLSRDERHSLLEKFPNEAEFIWPVLNAEDITSRPSIDPQRWIINFTNLTLKEAERAQGCLARIRELVLPHRERQKRDANRENWWLYNEARPGLYSAIGPLQEVIVNPVVSKYIIFTLAPSHTVFTNALNVLATSSFASLAILQSGTHVEWALNHCSTLESRTRYNPSDCFETFPFPPRSETSPLLDAAGELYHDHRAAVMIARNEGMTKTYNRFHDRRETAEDIERVRSLHADMDRAVLESYGWHDLAERAQAVFLDETNEVDHTYQGRLFWPSDFRDEILARLLALNTERHAEEVRLGIAPGKKGTEENEEEAIGAED